jgi:AcrR family transcriptional regulator
VTDVEPAAGAPTPGPQSLIARRRAAALGGRGLGYHQRRADIIRAAATVFKEKGYRGTSLADIAEAMSVDRATLYYYVGSKEELLDEVVTDLVEANLVTAEQIRDTDEPAPAKLRRLVTSLMCSYADHYPFLYVYLQENLGQVVGQRQAWAQQMRLVNRRYEEAVEAIVRTGIEEGTLRPVTDPRVLAFGVMGMVSWTHRWFNPQRTTTDAQTIGAAYVDVLLNGMTVATETPAPETPPAPGTGPGP